MLIQFNDRKIISTSPPSKFFFWKTILSSEKKEEQISCAQMKNVDQIEKRWRWREVIVLDDDSMQLLIKVLFSQNL